MKIADDLIGRFLVSLLPAGQASPGVVRPLTVLIIRPGGIGDAALLSPVIHILRERFPGISIDVLAERRNAGVFELVPGIRKVFLYDTFSGVCAILSHRYDVVIDTEQWYRLSAVVARLIRADVRIGYGSNERKRLFSHPVHYSQDEYELTSFLRLLEPLGVHEVRPGGCQSLAIPAEAEGTARELLTGLSGRPYIVIFPGASIPEKRWAPEKFQRLTQSLRAAGHSLVIIGAESERAVGEILCRNGCDLNLAGQTSLAETAAVLSRAALLVSGDSGVLHMAVSLGTPTVALFGPSNRRKWSPEGETHKTLSADVTCSPCSFFGKRPTCSRDRMCMDSITAEAVVSAVKALL